VNQDPLQVPTALLPLDEVAESEDFWEVYANRKKTLVIFDILFSGPY
jgi:hypothetical protein